MPRYIRAQRDEQRDRDAEDERDDTDDGIVEPRRQQEEKPAVHRDGAAVCPDG